MPSRGHVTFDQAIQYAFDKRRQNLPNWANMLVSYGENIEKHSMLAFAFKLVEHFANAHKDSDAIQRLRQLSQIIEDRSHRDTSELREYALETWGPSFVRKSVSRLYEALAFQVESDDPGYQAALSKALGTVILDEHGEEREMDFEIVINVFKKEFQS